MDSRLLALDHVTKRFGGVRALEDVCVTFEGSSIVGVVGPNGAGKSTLLNVVSGFEQPDGGRVTVAGADVGNLPPWEIARRGVARLFQEVRLAQSATVLDNLLLAQPGNPGERLHWLLQRRKIARFEQAAEVAAIKLLRTVQLNETASVVAADLSYGQQRLVGLTCCLMMTPSICLLDEPFAGLAPVMRQTVGIMTDDLRASGALVIIVEHDIEALQEHADRLLVLSGGVVVADGPPKSVLADARVRSILLG